VGVGALWLGNNARSNEPRDPERRGVWNLRNNIIHEGGGYLKMKRGWTKKPFLVIGDPLGI